MKVDGEEVGRGSGGDILGHPMNALAWLANHSVRLGKPLKSGSFVMLGSVVKTVFLEQPSQINIGFEYLGEVSVKFIA